MKSNKPVILIVKYRALGDSVMGLSTITYLRTIYPDSKIYYGVRSWTAKLYEKVDLDADGVVEIKLDNISDYFNLFFKIKSLGITHIHELHLSGRTYKFFNLFKSILRYKYSYHDHHSKSGKVLDQGVIKSLIQRDLDGVYSHLGRNTPPNYLDYVPSFNLSNNGRLRRVILGVVATRETKMWPLEYYLKLANIIKKTFDDIEIAVPLSTSHEDQLIRKKLLEIDKEKLLNLVYIPLCDLPAYFGDSLLYVGNDTGLKHIGVASGIKTYTLFGPEPPNEWHPYNREVHPYFYRENLECRTLTAHYCGLNKCETMICLNMISAETVFNEIKKELEL